MNVDADKTRLNAIMQALTKQRDDNANLAANLAGELAVVRAELAHARDSILKLSVGTGSAAIARGVNVNGNSIPVDKL
jgi:hypothetical protein